jgi:cytochrome c biogenesis protein CcmG/thiol:disulfide interchange protein DsbE
MRRMLRLLLVGLFLGAVWASEAAPTKKLDRLKVGSLTYSNVTVVNVSPTDLYFSYEKGIKNVKLRLLDSEMQKLFNFDPKAAEELEKKQAEDAAQFQSTVAATSSRGAASGVGASEPDKKSKSSQESLADPISDRSLIGKSAPPITIDKWLGSMPAPTLKGKFVLLAFVAPWSVPSQKAVSQLDGLQKAFTGKIEFAGLLPEADADDRSLDSKFDFPFAVDEKNKLASAFAVMNVPCVVLLNPNGLVLYQGHPAALGERELRALLAKAPAEAK